MRETKRGPMEDKIRNSKSEGNPKLEFPKQERRRDSCETTVAFVESILMVRIWDFDFPSDFEFRI
jgi:hypothetical protein